jgi:hypothetical protein
MVLVHESGKILRIEFSVLSSVVSFLPPPHLPPQLDPRFGAFDFAAAYSTAPDDLKTMISNHESLPFRRRGYERDGMLHTLIEQAGFKALLEGARAPVTTTKPKELAKVPAEIQHFDLRTLHDRPVQTALVELLLLPKQDKRFTSCVVVHGMGGTGKTVTTVAVVQEKAVREHFSHIYWLVIGADMVGDKIRQLQSVLHKQLTGKGMTSAEMQEKDEQEWLGMLVEAMTMDRAMVVLDDPWLPEQVRFLNPVDSAQTEHRLLVTTRIRGLAHSRATCIELSMMGKDEAVALLLDVAGITQEVYQIDNPGSQWPPPASYDLATECGLLPITLTITAQLVRSWGKGWEVAVLPLLQEEQGAGSGRSATTVEERVIGAGLKSLKGNADAPAIEALFGVFAATQEDFVHPMAVIELLWRSCSTPSTEASGKGGGNISMGARLKVRQWTQLLIDHSLLLGSSSKGVHLHDIVLTYLRGTQPASELRALQKRVVEGLLAASAERTAATGRGFQDTGSTAKAFEGEEVDWYVCNVASYHVKQSMDPSSTLVENEDLKQWIQVDDEPIVRAVAVAVGTAGLELLLVDYSAAEEWLKASKVAWAIGMVSIDRPSLVKHGKAALDFLHQIGSATTAVQQLELDMRGKLTFMFSTRGPDKKPNAARMMELMAQDKSLRCDPMGLCLMSIFPRLFALFGVHPLYWDAGKIATQDTVCEGLRLGIYEAGPLGMQMVEESVGARKECIRIGHLTAHACNMTLRTDQTADEYHRFLEEQWGKDGSILTASCMDYRFDRHFAISKSMGMRLEPFLGNPFVQGVAEYCGDVQHMVQLFEKQIGAMREYYKRRVSGDEVRNMLIWAAPSFTGLELNALHPFGKELAGLLRSCEGRCADPSDCAEWIESSQQWSAHRARHGEGITSKDGLHHMWLKPTTIAGVQAVLSLSLASMGNCNFDVSWLDDLPAADDPKLHCSGAAVFTFANARVLIAEVLEWQGRHKEAIRCENITRLFMHASAHPFMCVTCFCACSITALRLPNYKRTSTSPHSRRCVQGECSDDVMRRWGSTHSRCQHSTRLSSWQVSGACCYQRR